MYVQGKFKHYNDDLTDIFQLWNEVFVTELHLYQEISPDANEVNARYCVILDPKNDKRIVAAGRIYQTKEGNYILDRVAVLKNYRHNYYADMLVRMLVNQAFLAGSNEVVTQVVTDCIPFFKKIGFVLKEEESPSLASKMILKSNHMCTKCQCTK